MILSTPHRNRSRMHIPLRTHATRAAFLWVALSNILCVFGSEPLAKATSSAQELGRLGACRADNVRDLYSNSDPNRKELRILITRFAGTNAHEEEFGLRVGQALHDEVPLYLRKALKPEQSKLTMVNLRVDYVRCVVRSHDEARQIGHAAHANAVFWGHAYCDHCDNNPGQPVNLNLYNAGNNVQNSAGGKISNHLTFNIPPPPEPQDAFKTSLTVVRWKGLDADGGRAMQMNGPSALAGARLPRLASRRVKILLDSIVGLFAMQAGRHGLAVELFDSLPKSVLAAVEGADDLYRMMGKSLMIAGYPDRSLESLGRAHKLCTHGDPSCIYETNYRLGWAHERVGNEAKALEHYEAALKSVEDRNYFIKAATLIGMGRLATAKNEKAIAHDLCEKGRQIFKRIGSPLGQAKALSCLGGLATAMDDPHKAMEQYEQALQFLQKQDDIEDEAIVRIGLGRVYVRLGDGPQAQKYYENALDAFRLIGDRSGQAVALSELARLKQAHGKQQQAAELYNEALLLAVASKDARTEAAIRESQKNLSPIIVQPPLNQ